MARFPLILVWTAVGAVVWGSAIGRLEAGTADPERTLSTFREPTVLKSAEMYMDGGTRRIQMVDASSQTLTFCLDGGLKRWTPGSQKPAQLFFGAHPRSAEAKAIPIGSAAELRILKLLENWKIAGGPMTSPTGDSATFPTEQVVEWYRKNVDSVIQVLRQRNERIPK